MICDLEPRGRQFAIESVDDGLRKENVLVVLTSPAQAEREARGGAINADNNANNAHYAEKAHGFVQNKGRGYGGKDGRKVDIGRNA